MSDLDCVQFEENHSRERSFLLFMLMFFFQSNGWDANEMFKFNEEAYGVKSTYDSSLSMYT